MESRADETLPPTGIRLVADTALDRRDRGRLLIGGAPLRIIRLSDAGAEMLAAWLEGTPLADDTQARTLARRLLDAAVVHPVVDPIGDPDATVVIPAYNDADGLACCLASLGDLPVVVVDDASRNAAEIAAACEKHGARLLRHDTNQGPAAARNTGLAAVTTSLVAFVDTDVEAWPGWINHLVGHFGDRRVAAVAPRVRSRPGDSLLERYETHHSPLDLGANPASVAPHNPVSYVPAAALVARVDAVTEIGGFDSGMRTGEDVDLVWRLTDSGKVVRYDPSVDVEHRPRRSWTALLGQRRNYGSSAAALGIRHGARVAPARCSGWSAAAWAALAAGHPILGLGLAAGSAVALKRKLGPLPDSLPTTARIAGIGHLHAGYGIARAVARVWWPPATLLALIRPRSQRLIVAAVFGPPLLDWIRGSRPAGLPRSLALRLADDLAYGTGIWQGVLQTGDATSLTPDLPSGPTQTVETQTDS
ncbi:MAG: mycofactocin biosynthesis glycosyltransferase MftF [Acidimicrobiaceae bacterium]|nr:mycofactocin biosynthesis glycosyltransferase MftF [Acidimicrobiia bacterium]MCY4493529.1 mycofactocin biosynthesis glycosyltransferase MftF [Acidimicrobiaceae bacterium]